jgi:hypothetical protein
VVPVPFLTPRLSSLWIGLVTPLPPSLARPLVDSLVNEVVVRHPDEGSPCPEPGLGYREAVAEALDRTRRGDVVTRWGGPDEADAAAPLPTDPDWSGGSLLQDIRTATVAAPPAVVYDVVCSIGGARGWYSSHWLWAVRGLLDSLVGGPGLRRGRRDPRRLRVGDALDFWRVTDLQPDRLVRLRAEMRLPGLASLEWQIEPGPEDGHSAVRQVATFVPRGLWGRVYWYSVALFHRLVFPSLLAGIGADAERRASGTAPAAP